MIRGLKSLSLTVMVVGSFWMSFSAAGQTEFRFNPKVGKLHPDFTLPSVDDGKSVKLSDFRGKKVLLVHFASW